MTLRLDCKTVGFLILARLAPHAHKACEARLSPVSLFVFTLAPDLSLEKTQNTAVQTGVRGRLQVLSSEHAHFEKFRSFGVMHFLNTKHLY